MEENTLEFIKEKMINQMRYNKQIYSLNEILSVVYTLDFSGNKKVSISGLDPFLSEFGIFLSSHEVSTLLKYIKKDQTSISVQKFSEIFKIETPQQLINKCSEVFGKLSEGNNYIRIQDLWRKCNLRKHPLVTIFGRKPDYAKKKLEEGINFSAVGGNSINLKEFIELHKNMYALLPPDNQKYFLNLIPEMWGVA